ncbi:gliding motility-associated C-terminal domain-containing protein [Taibaiella helva]|uniref:gliding motility-associated C-terminal domain-containing protein n=1 Tax=Taibaiella helva TaxID=2301235 RepID=UPI000E56BC9A|nr:gliding motility-associated C-terminal domain-containing protein [Taibaiella helva]
MKRILLFWGICCLWQSVCAQKQGNIWYFGQGAGLDFNASPPAPLSGALNTNEGCASIADPATGQLLLYTDGITVWDRTHTPMPGSVSTPLNGDPSSTQSGVIVPLPGNSSIYYIVTTPAQVGGASPAAGAAMCYSVVDLSLNGGNGDLVSVNNVLIDSSTEKIAVTSNCDKTAYWVVGHRWSCDSFYAFKLTAAGFAPPVKSKVGSAPGTPFSSSTSEAIGYMKFSANGAKLGMVTYVTRNTMELFDFNAATGVVSNPITDLFTTIDSPFDGPYGCSFSPDNSKFYVSVNAYPQSKVFQYDLTAGSAAAIIASRTLIGSSSMGLWALQNGPDGKMYVAVTPSIAGLDVIQNPNAAGLACGYTANAAALMPGTFSTLGLPCMVESFLSPVVNPAFYLPTDSVVCLGDTLDAPQTEHPNFSISPMGSVIINADSSLIRFAPRLTTTYTIIKRNSCGYNDTIPFTVHVVHPVADFFFDPAAPTLDDRQIQLVNNSKDATAFTWYDTTYTWLSNATDYIYPISRDGEVCFRLEAKDSWGCADTVTKCVEIRDMSYLLFVPNSFTPNGDGRNDIFKISGVNIQLENLAVFNRYGERIFYTNDIDKGWDGTYKGAESDIGSYFYLVRYKNPWGARLEKKGDVTLVR